MAQDDEANALACLIESWLLSCFLSYGSCFFYCHDHLPAKLAGHGAGVFLESQQELRIRLEAAGQDSVREPLIKPLLEHTPSSQRF
ncbi:MAG: hypothetical protein LBQ25_01745 [Azonexus sp.]|jgi:hypothetical protein|nr:hypothetical protein [Azonexus sp.]